MHEQKAIFFQWEKNKLSKYLILQDALLEKEVTFPSQQGFLVKVNFFVPHWGMEFGAECQEKNLKLSHGRIHHRSSWMPLLGKTDPPSRESLRFPAPCHPLCSRAKAHCAGHQGWKAISFDPGMKKRFKDAQVEAEEHRFKGKLPFSALDEFSALCFQNYFAHMYKVSLNFIFKWPSSQSKNISKEMSFSLAKITWTNI